jgi:hypothetical protein
MAIPLMRLLIFLFRPEGAPRMAAEDESLTMKSRPVARKISVSAKALFWAALSILVGLIIGQLS